MGWTAQMTNSVVICDTLCQVIAILQSSAQLSIMNSWDGHAKESQETGIKIINTTDKGCG